MNPHRLLACSLALAASGGQTQDVHMVVVVGGQLRVHALMRSIRRFGSPAKRVPRMVPLLTLLPLVSTACEAATRDLDDLLVRDSMYYVPETMEPYSGRVRRMFRDDPTEVELEGTMRGGTWHGELTVFHPNGRVRYSGSLANGTQCGAWVENADAEPPESVYEDLVKEIESMGLYPPCPDGL